MKKLFSLLICAVLILGMTFFTVPANAIEIDAPSIGTITSMENMMKIAESYVSPTGLYQGDKKYCYLALFRAGVAGITDFSGDFMYNGALTMVECTPSKAMIDLKRSNDFSFGSPSGNSQKMFDFSTNDSISAPAVGTDLFEFHIQGDTYINPQTFNTSYSITYGGQSKMDTGLTLKKVLMGDVNGDGAVSESDALAIMHAIGGKITITGDYAIAADVDRDGKVDASDALAVLQYSTSKLTSFWNHGYNSTEENESITSGKIYRMRCNDTGKNLKIPATGKTVLSDYERTSDDYKFRFTYLGNGLYKIAKKADGTSVLTADSGDVSFATYNSSNAGQKWYVNSKNGEDFYLSPLNAKNTFLTSSGTTSAEHGYNAVGGLWRIYGAEVTIYNYYDTGMLTRWSCTEQQMEDFINARTDEAIEYFKYLGVDAKRGTTKHVQSSADTCTGASTNEQLNRMCTHDSKHKDNHNLFIDFFDKNCKSLSASNPFIPIFWTGHFTWDPPAEGETYDVNKRVTNGGFSWGVYKKADGIIMLNNGNDGTIETSFSESALERIRHTVHHELGHAIAGLPDSYCSEKPSQPCTTPECYKHNKDAGRGQQCFMSGLHDFSGVSYENYLCPKCKSDALINIDNKN